MFFFLPLPSFFSFIGDKQQLCYWHSAEKGKLEVSNGTKISSSGVNQIFQKAEIRNSLLSTNKWWFLALPLCARHFNFPFKWFLNTSLWSGKGKDQVSIHTVEGLNPILFSVHANHTEKPRCDAITKAKSRFKQQICPTVSLLATKSLQVGAELSLGMGNPAGQGNWYLCHSTHTYVLQRALHRLPGPPERPSNYLVK